MSCLCLSSPVAFLLPDLAKDFRRFHSPLLGPLLGSLEGGHKQNTLFFASYDKCGVWELH